MKRVWFVFLSIVLMSGATDVVFACRIFKSEAGPVFFQRPHEKIWRFVSELEGYWFSMGESQGALFMFEMRAKPVTHMEIAKHMRSTESVILDSAELTGYFGIEGATIDSVRREMHSSFKRRLLEFDRRYRELNGNDRSREMRAEATRLGDFLHWMGHIVLQTGFSPENLKTAYLLHFYSLYFYSIAPRDLSPSLINFRRRTEHLNGYQHAEEHIRGLIRNYPFLGDVRATWY